MVQEIKNFGTYNISKRGSWYRNSSGDKLRLWLGQVWLKEDRREVEIKGFMIKLWMLCFIARLFEDQETEQGNRAGLERGEAARLK